MKNLLLALSLSLLIGTVFTLNSCKKETTEDDSVSAQDAASVMGGISTTADDASASAGQVSTFTGKTQGLYAALCGVSVLDTTSNSQQISITYDGATDCQGFKRYGSITVSLTGGTHWEDVGAQLTISYNALQITDVLSGNTYTVNGSHTITNVLGGLACKIPYGLVTNDSTIHTNATTGTGMSITFPNATQRNWTFNRSSKWSSVYAGGHNTITVTEYTTAAGNIDIQGTNGYGNTFTSSILTPIASDNMPCSGFYYLPYQGQVQHQVGSRTATVTYGTNATGTAIGNPTTCGSGLFIQYTNAANGHSASRFVPY